MECQAPKLVNTDACPRPTTQECKLACEVGFAASSGAVITLACDTDPVHGGPATPDGNCEENKCAHYVFADGEMPGDADGCNSVNSFRLLPSSDAECTLKCRPGYTATEDPFKVECPAGSADGDVTTKCATEPGQFVVQGGSSAPRSPFPTPLAAPATNI